jgi:DUF4097 and DUF4098 domain-containing protein YvlB
MTALSYRFFPGLLAISLLVAGCDINVGEHGFSMDVATGKAQDEWTRSYTLQPGGRLEIVNVNGTINAEPGDGGKVEVKAERRVKARTDEAAREVLNQIQMVEDVSPERVRIETKVPRMSRIDQQVQYWVKVPKGLSVSFETVNGGVRLENLDGQIVASTTNGGVRGRGLRGSVKAETTNGGVEIDMVAVTGEIDLDTTNGGIKLRLPGDTKANLEARCTNGGISVEEPLSIEVSEKSRRHLRGTMNGGGLRISAETTNGGIRISKTGERTETH